MAEELKAGCARPTGGPVGETAPEKTLESENAKKEVMSMIQVGKKAPDFIGAGLSERQIHQCQIIRSSWEMGSSLFLSRRFYICLSN